CQLGSTYAFLYVDHDTNTLPTILILPAAFAVIPLVFLFARSKRRTRSKTQKPASVDTFSAAGGSVRVALLNQAQYFGFVNCNCVPYGNYTSATWMAPLATSYTTPVTIPASGVWYLAFFEPPGTSNPLSISETVKLISLTTYRGHSRSRMRRRRFDASDPDQKGL